MQADQQFNTQQEGQSVFKAGLAPDPDGWLEHDQNARQHAALGKSDTPKPSRKPPGGESNEQKGDDFDSCESNPCQRDQQDDPERIREPFNRFRSLLGY
jgi:hypothetical protein